MVSLSITYSNTISRGQIFCRLCGFTRPSFPVHTTYAHKMHTPGRVGSSCSRFTLVMLACVLKFHPGDVSIHQSMSIWPCLSSCLSPLISSGIRIAGLGGNSSESPQYRFGRLLGCGRALGSPEPVSHQVVKLGCHCGHQDWQQHSPPAAYSPA